MSKKVLVTGASRGIGLAICQRLLESGYQVFGLARSYSNGMEDLSLKFSEAFKPIEFDLSQCDEIPALVSEITKKNGNFYGLVNNAGIGWDGLLATQHAKDISQILRINLEAPILMAKYLSRGMLLEGEGRIIQISSIIAQSGFNGLSVYGASKAGLEGFTRCLARELGRANITVNNIAPGFVETSMTEGLGSEQMDSIRRRAPIGLATAADIAGAVRYLLSAEAQKITGITLTVDGGSRA